MYAPGNWAAWVSDGMAHANLLCAMWLVALALRSYRIVGPPPRDKQRRDLLHSAYGCCFAALLNAALVVMHLFIWRHQMGY